jgi:hypothetical protein
MNNTFDTFINFIIIYFGNKVGSFGKKGVLVEGILVVGGILTCYHIEALYDNVS